MKKVLFITLDFPPYKGGVATFYKNVCDFLPAKDLFVIAPQTSDSDNFDESKKYRIYRKKMLSKNSFVWPKWAGLAKDVYDIVKKEKIEAILAGQILPIGTIAYIMKINKNIPYYIFCHGRDISMLSGRKKIVAKKVIRQAKGIFANSNFTKHLVENYKYPHSHIYTIYPCPEVLPNPSDLEMIKVKNKYNLHNKKILLTVGRIIERKGHDMAIKALPQVIKKHSNTVYVIAGEGPHKQALQVLARQYEVSNHVIFTGIIEDGEASCLYELCDIFVMPARQLANKDVEGFGIVYLEANLFGKPAIGGRSGGIPEAIVHEKTGILVDPMNIDEITRNILYLLDNPDKAHVLGIQGMDRVHSQFQWHNQVEKIKKIIY